MKLFSLPKLLGPVFLLALILRIYSLGDFPVGFHADEARVGWNAYSILKTGEDDRGNKLALYYNTFGDYRPTGIFYLAIPAILVFGNTEFAVRLPSALLGALTVFVIYFLTREVLIRLDDKGKLKDYSSSVALVAAFLFAVSPWHINTSRSTSEVVIAMFFALAGLYLLIRFLNTPERKLFVYSFLSLIVSYFFYHSVRILIPLFVGVIAIYYWKIVRPQLRKILTGAFIALSLTTFIFALNPEARGRFTQVSIFNDLDVAYELSKMPYEEGPGQIFIARLFHNKPTVYARKFINEYVKYFSADFLIGETGKPARYKTVGIGVVTYVELFLLVFGFIAVAQKKFSTLPLLFLLVASLPAALTTEDSPNLHRSLFMVPFISIIGAYGIFSLTLIKNWGKLISRSVFALLVLNFIFYIHMYYVHDKVHAPLYRNVGAKELALKLNGLQDKYEKIILTNIPDDPYPWIAFFTLRDPATFNKDAIKREHGVWATENFVFTGQRCPSRDAFKSPDVDRLLVVDADGCASASNLVGKQGIDMSQIIRSDGTEAYTLWSTIE